MQQFIDVSYTKVSFRLQFWARPFFNQKRNGRNQFREILRNTYVIPNGENEATQRGGLTFLRFQIDHKQRRPLCFLLARRFKAPPQSIRLTSNVSFITKSRRCPPLTINLNLWSVLSGSCNLLYRCHFFCIFFSFLFCFISLPIFLFPFNCI